jgi:hypothetical protein
MAFLRLRWRTGRALAVALACACLVAGCGSTDPRACGGSASGSLESWMAKFDVPRPACSLDKATFYAIDGRATQLEFSFVGTRECIESYVTTLNLKQGPGTVPAPQGATRGCDFGFTSTGSYHYLGGVTDSGQFKAYFDDSTELFYLRYN